MTLYKLSQYFSILEKETLRNKMTEELAKLFSETSKDEIDKICYLLQGRVASLFSSIEFGMAEKMVIKAIAQGLEVGEKKVKQVYKEKGDLGKTVEKIKNQKSKIKNTYQKINIEKVYNILVEIAKAEGEGSQEKKITLLANLLRDIGPLSARFIARIPVGKLRLGFSDMTILDSLSWMMAGDKSLRKEIEKAYNVYPDLGAIAKQFKKGGVGQLQGIKPKVGVPILMAQAERLTTTQEIIDKIGECAVEAKYDGLRLQVHFVKEQRTDNKEQTTKNREQKSAKDTSEEIVKLFSRNLEDVTYMYPDIVAGVKKEIKAKEAIFEGEAIGFNPKTGRFLPFQQTVQRKRKYGIAEMTKKIPLKLIAFELLYVDGESLLNEPYSERRKRLEEILSGS